MLRTSVSGITAAAVVLATVAPVLAKDSEQERKKRATVLIQQGQTKYDLGKFDEAIILFEQAYEVWPYPEALYNLGQCWRKKKDLERAIFYFKAYLRNAPNATNHREVEERIDELERLLAEQQASVEKPPTGVNVPGPADESPSHPSPGLALAPSSPDPTTGATKPQDELPSSSRAWHQDPLAWTISGVGGAALLTGGAFLFSAAAERDQAASEDTEGERQKRLAKAQDREDVGKVLLVGGAVVAVVGVALLAYNPPQKSSSAKVRRIAIGLDGVAISWSF